MPWILLLFFLVLGYRVWPVAVSCECVFFCWHLNLLVQVLSRESLQRLIQKPLITGTRKVCQICQQVTQICIIVYTVADLLRSPCDSLQT